MRENTSYETYLDFALSLVRRTRALIQSYDIESLATELKSDKSPVTVVDRAVEALITSAIKNRYPGHGIIGEEDGTTNPEAEFIWTIDPIDGTQNLATGFPSYGTMIGLIHEGRSVVGVIDHPALNLTYYASFGGGAYCDGTKISTDASRGRYDLVSTSTRTCCARTDQPQVFDKIHSEFKDSRVLYDCIGHTQVAHGRLGVLVEWGAHIWDVVATAVIVREAGGVYVPYAAPRGLYCAVLGRHDLVRRVQKSLSELGLEPIESAGF